jgi:hypothetical protein
MKIAVAGPQIESARKTGERWAMTFEHTTKAGF